MRDLTLSEIERLQVDAVAAEQPFVMDEESFRAFYEETARPLWAYLSRVLGDNAMADDLVQEAYYRFLRAAPDCETEAHRRHYLFRVASNLARDHWRRPRPLQIALDEAGEGAVVDGSQDLAADTARRKDLGRAWAHLSRRDRELLWLAYAHGSAHREIAAALGLRTASIKLMLFRARKRLARLLRQAEAEVGQT
ncbi:MAG: sigma-70 family RNA polymerase sigma factor [Luteitalea sp.]|nr:sigma-70 family RNA polymerase sigma factor [Luteitalea sp.]